MIFSGTNNVGTAAVALGSVCVNPSRIHITNLDNTKTVYLGASTVGTADGYRLLKQQSLEFDLNPAERLYALSSSGGHLVTWLQQVC